MNRRILLISHHRAFKTRVGWRVHGVARVLAARGCSVTVLCTADQARFGVREYAEDGVLQVETPDLLWGRQRSGWDPWNAWHRADWLRGKKFDLVHAFDTRPAVIHPLLGYLKDQPTPLVIDWCDWWGRGGLIEENRPAWYRSLFGRLETYYEEHYRIRADATTVIARGLAMRAHALGVSPDSIFHLPNGCWPDRLQPSAAVENRALFDLPKGDFIAGFTAMDVTIGFDLVIEAFRLAAEKSPGLTLVITGRLPPAQLSRLAKAGLGRRVRYLGMVPAQQYPVLLGCIDVFLLPFPDRPANHGRWPGRINDYLCAGRPVISQPVGEMKSLFTSESIGLLCNTAGDMAGALLDLQHNPKLRTEFGINARHLAEGRLSWPALATQLEAAYACASVRFEARGR